VLEENLIIHAANTLARTRRRSSSSSSSSVTSYASTVLFPPCLIVSSKVFQVVFVHSVYNSALFLPSCCSFFLQVVANFICIFLVSQLFLLSTLPKFHLDWCQSFLSFCLRIQISLPHKRMWVASALYVFFFPLENFWTKVCLKMLFRIPSIWANYWK